MREAWRNISTQTEQGAKADLGSEEEELEFRETVTGTQKLHSGEMQTRWGK